MKTLDKLIYECKLRLKSGKANYQNTMECDYLLRNLIEIKEEITPIMDKAINNASKKSFSKTPKQL